MLDGDPLFEAIWQAIKGWDISRHKDGMYSGPTGNDARHIYDAVQAVLALPDAQPLTTDAQPTVDPWCEEHGCQWHLYKSRAPEPKPLTTDTFDPANPMPDDPPIQQQPNDAVFKGFRGNNEA